MKKDAGLSRTRIQRGLNESCCDLRSVQFSEHDWVHVFKCGLLEVDGVSFTRLLWHSLCVNLDSLCLGFSLFSVICKNTINESLSALRLAYMFNANVNALWQNATTDTFVNDNTNGMLCYVKDSTSLTVVEFVWNTLLNGTISHDINIVSLSVVSEQL